MNFLRSPWQYCRIYALNLPTSWVITGVRGAKAAVSLPRRSPPRMMVLMCVCPLECRGIVIFYFRLLVCCSTSEGWENVSGTGMLVRTAAVVSTCMQRLLLHRYGISIC